MSVKIYLAKSNRANPDIVMNVRENLSKYNVDIVEYSGGGYTHKDLKGCDYLIVIPDIKNVTTYGKLGKSAILVGKGLLEQIEVFSGQNVDKIGIVLDSKLLFGICEGVKVIDSTDYINYGKVSTTTETLSFSNYMSNILKLPQKQYILKDKPDSHLSIML